METKDEGVFFWAPVAIVDSWGQMIQVTLSALLAGPVWYRRGYVWPLQRLLRFPHNLAQ